MRPRPSQDVLCFEFEQQLKAFLLQNAENQHPLLNELRTLSAAESLSVLSALLKAPQFTLSIQRHFSPLLVDLCARWLEDDIEDERKFSVFALLLPAHQELYQ